MLQKGSPRYHLRHFDWQRATLDDVLGPFKLSTLSSGLAEKKFDVSSPFTSPDVCSDEAISPTDAATSLQRQYYTRNSANVGYDWYVIVQSIDGGEFLIVATANNFTKDVDPTDPVKTAEDIVNKRELALTTFRAAGWDEQQVVFRFAVHQHVPDFDETILSKFADKNIVVCGREELEGGASPSFQHIFAASSFLRSPKSEVHVPADAEELYIILHCSLL